jgi:hypothetical protein
MIRHSAKILRAILTATAVVASVSTEPTVSAAPIKKAAHDPNERICEDLYVGTRVNAKRYCGTRAEWEALKQQDREEVQKAQRPLQCNKIMGKSC